MKFIFFIWAAPVEFFFKKCPQNVVLNFYVPKMSPNIIAHHFSQAELDVVQQEKEALASALTHAREENITWANDRNSITTRGMEAEAALTQLRSEYDKLEAKLNQATNEYQVRSGAT